ncbi:MAG TPA: NIPSNAP family containing protein, partial [Puia sp.]
MNRRNFLHSAALAGAALPFKSSNMDNTRGSKQQWYELRTYTFAENAQRDLTTAYLEKALLPALNRAGC